MRLYISFIMNVIECQSENHPKSHRENGHHGKWTIRKSKISRRDRQWRKQNHIFEHTTSNLHKFSYFFFKENPMCNIGNHDQCVSFDYKILIILWKLYSKVKFENKILIVRSKFTEIGVSISAKLQRLLVSWSLKIAVLHLLALILELQLDKWRLH